MSPSLSDAMGVHGPATPGGQVEGYRGCLDDGRWFPAFFAREALTWSHEAALASTRARIERACKHSHIITHENPLNSITGSAQWHVARSGCDRTSSYAS